jgi:hypothetical protein
MLLGWSVATPAAEIHRCPQADGTTRFQDRPCGAGPARAPAAPGAAGPATGEAPSTRDSRPAPLPAPAVRAPARPPSVDESARAPSTVAAPFAREPAGLADSRADYLARNAARCRDGDRRACAAVTCERSGRLDSPACQEAVGYLRGPGWDLRPRTDLFDPGRTADEFTLTCRGTPRRATLTRARGSDVYLWPGTAGNDGASPTPPAAAGREVARAALPEAATAFCARG